MWLKFSYFTSLSDQMTSSVITHDLFKSCLDIAMFNCTYKNFTCINIKMEVVICTRIISITKLLHERHTFSKNKTIIL